MQISRRSLVRNIGLGIAGAGIASRAPVRVDGALASEFFQRIMLPLLVGLLMLTFLAAPVRPQALDASLLTDIKYRNLGPYRTGAWVTDFAVPENGRQHQYTFYVAMRSGGVWKTSNNGTTFTPVFDAEGAQAIGDVR